jgi:hypothetical protein
VFHGWETNERVLESGGFESRQRVLAREPLVEHSESGARWLGLARLRRLLPFELTPFDEAAKQAFNR